MAALLQRGHLIGSHGPECLVSDQMEADLAGPADAGVFVGEDSSFALDLELGPRFVEVLRAHPRSGDGGPESELFEFLVNGTRVGAVPTIFIGVGR